MKTIRIDLSAPQDTVTGRNLNKLLYGNHNILSLIKVESACPHNGGVHSLCISGTKEDLNAWLDLFGEEYPGSRPLVGALKEEMKTSTKSMIKAKDLRSYRMPINLGGHVEDPKWFNGLLEIFNVLAVPIPPSVLKPGLPLLGTPQKRAVNRHGGVITSISIYRGKARDPEYTKVTVHEFSEENLKNLKNLK